MGIISLRLPDSLHRRANLTSENDNVSLNQLIVTAIAEKLSALETETYLQERSQRGDRSHFESALSRVRDGAPESYDAFTEEIKPKNNKKRHQWTEENELVAYYLYRCGDKNLEESKEAIGELLGMGWNSLALKIANFKALEGKGGYDGFSRQAQRVYEQNEIFSDDVLWMRVQEILIQHLQQRIETLQGATEQRPKSK